MSARRPSGGLRPGLGGAPGERLTLTVALLVLLIGCDGESETEPARSPATPPGAAAASGDPNAALIERWRRTLPPDALVRRGACPLECCEYGSWEAESEITLLRAPDSAAAAAATLSPGTTFHADSGFVAITGISLLAVADTVEEAAAGLTLLSGDTLVVLDYVGEGFFNVWFEGRVYQVTGFWGAEVANPRAELLGRYASEWWVHASGPDATAGWFRADSPAASVAGADACTGPRRD